MNRSISAQEETDETHPKSEGHYTRPDGACHVWASEQVGRRVGRTSGAGWTGPSGPQPQAQPGCSKISFRVKDS